MVSHRELKGYFWVGSHPTDILLYFHHVCLCHYVNVFVNVCVSVYVEEGMVDFPNSSNRVNPLLLRNVLSSHRDQTGYRHTELHQSEWLRMFPAFKLTAISIKATVELGKVSVF